MEKNEVIQVTIVAVIVLLALLWIIVRLIRNSRKKDIGGCSGCAESDSCSLKELHGRIKNSKKPENCHDGQSARY